ncbi:hypothetical protein D3C72_1438040 [compost metagenome]
MGAQVRRSLDAHRRAEQQPRDGDGPQEIVEIRFSMPGHPGIGFGAEILDDDFLDVAVPLVQVADRDQRIDALLTRLADTDQDTGGEGNRKLSSQTDGLQPGRRCLVRRTEMRSAAFAQPIRYAFQHQPLAYRHLAQPGDVRRPHDAGVHVRQQPGLGRYQLTDLGQVA